MATILIVDDDATSRDLLVALLRDHGHRLLEAGDGSEALTLARAEPIDLIISDILMPTMDGYELVRQLRADPTTAAIPVIFYSAHYLRYDATKLAESCGVTAILTKAADPEVVRRTVDAALHMATAPQPPVPEKTFDREHRQLLTNQLSDTTNELRIRNERLMMLIELNHRLSSSTDPLHILEWLCRGARELIGCRYAAVGILDQEGHQLRHFLTSGMSAEAVARLGTPPARGGVLQAVLAEQRPQRFRIGDATHPQSSFVAFDVPHTSFLGVPVLSATSVSGWLCLLDKIGIDEFSAEDEELALTIATQLGRLYDNRRLVIDLQQRTGELEHEVLEHQRAQDDLAERVRLAALMADVGVALTHGGTLPVILQRCAAALVHRLEAAFARVWTLNEDQTVLELCASAGQYTHLDGSHGRIPVGQSLIGSIAAERVPHLSNAVIDDPRISDSKWATREGMVAFAGYPLLVEDRVVGVLALFARHPLTAVSYDTLAAVADAVALGIQRRWAAIAQAEDAQVALALARVGREMISSLDAPVILDRLCRLTTEVLGCDASCTLIWRPENKSLESIAAFSASAEEQEILRVLQLPTNVLPIPISALRDTDLIRIGIMLPRDVRAPGAAAPVQLGIVLRRGETFVGLQIAHWRNQPEPLAAVPQRIAHGIAQIASLGLAHGRLIEELERANRLKADFVSTMSHELRTPLNAIIGYNDLLLEGAFGKIDGEVREVLRKVYTRSRHLLDLVSATLDLSRLDKDETPLETTEVVLRDLVSKIEVETAPLRAEHPNVQFTAQVTSKRARLHTDVTKLSVVLRNLIGNAFKFTDAGQVSFVVADRGEGIEFAVSDTGIGIEPEEHDIIFEPFRQVAPYLTRRHGGVGLGLYVVRRLVEILSGTVRLTSHAGQGSTFRVWLPLDSPPRAKHVDYSAASPRIQVSA